MTEVTYARRPARTSQAEPPRPSRTIHVAACDGPSVVEFGRWRRTASIVRAVATICREGESPCAAIAHWRDGVQAGLIQIFAEHEPMVRPAIAAARGRASRRFDACSMEGAGHVIKVWARVGAVFFGRVNPSRAHTGTPTVLSGVELIALEKALDELVRQTAR